MPTSDRARSLPRRAFDAAARASFRLGFPVLRLWWRITQPTIEGVYVAVWHEERILLIRNSYQTAFSFPSGRRGRSEPPAEAAARELREEVGIDVRAAALRHAGELTIESPIMTDHVHLYELHLETEPEITLDHREVTWAAFEPAELARERSLLPVVERYLSGRVSPLTARP